MCFQGRRLFCRPVFPMPAVKSSTDDDALMKAYVGPFAVFLGFTLLLQFLEPALGWDHPSAAWWQRDLKQWVYPLQAVSAGCLVWHWRKRVQWAWSWKWSLIGAVAGALGIAFWLAPTLLADRLPVEAWFGRDSWQATALGLDARTEGFDPGLVFEPGGAAWWMAYVMRFFRAVVVVAFVEELFWRGFLMRLMVNFDRPWTVPFGQHSWRAYWVTTLLFMSVHMPVDYLGAFVYGSLTYALAVVSRSLGATVVMHAVANLLMGLAALAWNKPGLW